MAKELAAQFDAKVAEERQKHLDRRDAADVLAVEQAREVLMHRNGRTRPPLTPLIVFGHGGFNSPETSYYIGTRLERAQNVAEGGGRLLVGDRPCPYPGRGWVGA